MRRWPFPVPALKPAHMPGGQQRLPLIGVQRWLPLKDVDELVLLGVRVAKRGECARGETGEIDAEVGEAEEVSEWMLLPA